MRTEQAQARSRDAPVDVMPFQIRGRFLTAIAIRPTADPADPAFAAALDVQMAQSPHFFSNAPVLVDFEAVPEMTDAGSIRALVDALRARELQVFGVQNATAVQSEITHALGLIPIGAGREAPLPTDRQRRAEKLERLLPPDNKIITAPVRSGQLVVAERGDLTVVGSVASGAELVAGGSIHVYGRMRGRAKAGAYGDENARIFCGRLDAELLAIAGLYKTNETFRDGLSGRNVHVFLEDETLKMEVLA